MSDVNFEKDEIVLKLLSDKRYVVTSDGALISFKRSKLGRMLTPVFSKGYMRYQLVSDDGSKITVYAHRIIALALIPRPLGLEHVNHIDGVKTNNHPSNLEWVTVAENNQHAIDTGLRKSANGERLSKLTRENVTYIRERYAQGGITQRELCEMFGLKQNSVSMIINGKNWGQA